MDTALDGVDVSGKHILEIGAGDGYLASLLSARAADVSAIDAASWEGERHFPVELYDGTALPFPDASFDLLFSSNVLEHIPHLAAYHAEMRRVLRPDGRCVHIVPTAVWRGFTMLAHYPALPKLVLWKPSRPETGQGNAGSESRSRSLLAKVLIASRHGETGNAITEVFHLTARSWSRRMREGGWRVERIMPCGIFYTGYEMMGRRLGVGARRRLGTVLRCSTIALHLGQPGRC